MSHDEPFPFMKPGECGTFTLTDAQKREILAEALAQRAARDARLPDDAAAVRAICDGVHRLHDLGWRDAMYAPKDGSRLRLIEAGSSGIHEGYRDEIGFWIQDDDTWPSHPILWKPVVESLRVVRGNAVSHTGASE